MSVMLFDSISLVLTNIRHCRLKSHVLSSVGHGQFVSRAIHSLPLKNIGTLERSKLCDLFPNTVFTRLVSGKRRIDPPSDFLPFPWQRRKKFDPIESSGDQIRILDAAPTLPKSDLSMTESIKDLEDTVRRQFSLESGDFCEQLEINRQVLLKKVQQHPMDFDSWEVKIAIQTVKVRSLMERFKGKPFDRKLKVRVIHAIHKRNKMLRLLRNVDLRRFEWVTEELGIEYTPSPLGVVTVPYTRKNDIRRLTKEYCAKLIVDKRAAYHAKLKEQQESFLKEKEEILDWIAAEEKDLGIDKSDNSSGP